MFVGILLDCLRLITRWLCIFWYIYIYTYLHTAHISCDISPNMVLLHWLYPFFLNCKTSTWTMSTQKNLIWQISEHPPTGDLLHGLSYSWENSWLYLADDSRHLCCQPKRVVHSPLASRSLGVIMTYKPGKSFEPFLGWGDQTTTFLSPELHQSLGLQWRALDVEARLQGFSKLNFLFLKTGHPKKQRNRIPTIHFQVRAVSSGRLLWFFWGGLDFFTSDVDLVCSRATYSKCWSNLEYDCFIPWAWEGIEQLL